MLKIKIHPTLGIKVCSNGYILHPGFASKTNRCEKYWTRGTLYSNGYYVVVINKKRYPVHRLVAETFHENPNHLPLVDHMNNNPKDNREENLRWVNHTQNRLNCKQSIALRKKYNLPLDADFETVRKLQLKEYYKEKK